MIYQFLFYMRVYHEPQNTPQTTRNNAEQTGINERAIDKARVGHFYIRAA
jgi:hypothetical protein